MYIGQKVKSKVEFSGVPKGTSGYVVEDYGTGVIIAWDLPDRPFPVDKTPKEIAEMPAIHTLCPLKDGFDKNTELKYLEIH